MNVLVVRLRLIGDVVFTTPIVRALRRTYPDARLTYVVEPSAAPVVQHNPHLSRVVVVPHAKGWRRVGDDWRLARRLRAERFDVAIDLHGGPRSAFLTWASRAPTRVGYDVAGRAWMYTHVAHRPRGLLPRHSVASQWDLLLALDAGAFGAGADPVRDRVEMPPAARDREAVASRLARLGVAREHDVVVVHVSAGNPFRRWPEAAFSDLISALAPAEDRWVFVTSGPSDRGAVVRVVASARHRVGPAAPRIVDAEGFSLGELRALMDRAALFVGGDSGPLHIASTSDVPILGLFGPTLVERSRPWRPADLPAVMLDPGPLPCRPCAQRVCAPGDFRCLSSVTAARAIEAARALLDRAA